ncbi:uroporphyrinogen-III synthase [Trichormus azollae]|jgi:uroporphyrinogen-III synthase|uniref:Uroporphyrinogen III synthase HEM4 n=1 Tax=Nostoc azollae (strain 0708) TaxID=551115 RepID=D7DWW0_NOSA0|nr:uroporphyrinogen-III synthase [Trichormus azollae]ADI64133.1 Uroporphyrinogen III synthase HEM4 ['Nostoc azollae' 0708]
MIPNSSEINLLIPSSKLPLYAKKVLVTAPRNYACRLLEEIIKKGGLPILMSTIETCFLSDYTDLDITLQKLDKFNWIIFTSRNGIIAFFQRLHELNIPHSALHNCQLCALGKDTESLLSLCGRVDLIPEEPSPAGIVAELSKIPNIHYQTVLVPTPEVVGLPEPNIIPNLINDLHKLGMQVTRLSTYMTQCIDKNIYAVELNLIRQGMIDIIAFSSTAEVESFIRMFDSRSDYENSIIACFGPYTATNVQDLGLNVSIVSNDYSSFAGFTAAMADFLLRAC